LIRWLETVCFILDGNAVSLLNAGNGAIERVTELREEKIEDQETIIRLQHKFIEKNDENFQSAKNTVQEELKSYSSVLWRGCSNALSSKKLGAVIEKVSVSEEMSKNAAPDWWKLSTRSCLKKLKKFRQKLGKNQS
jgi:hypothetical protein